MTVRIRIYSNAGIYQRPKYLTKIFDQNIWPKPFYGFGFWSLRSNFGPKFLSLSCFHNGFNSPLPENSRTKNKRTDVWSRPSCIYTQILALNSNQKYFLTFEHFYQPTPMVEIEKLSFLKHPIKHLALLVLSVL